MKKARQQKSTRLENDPFGNVLIILSLIACVLVIWMSISQGRMLGHLLAGG